MTTVAITGAAGKTGRVVCRHFLEHGYEIRPIDTARVARAATATWPGISVSGCSAPT